MTNAKFNNYTITRLQDYTKAGFSIIEVIVSCVILGIAVLGFMNFFPTSSTMNARADRRNEAGVLAEDKIEELRAIGFGVLKDSIAAGDTTETNTIGHIIRTWTIRDSSSLIIADVNCIWRTPGAPGHSNLRIMTQIANYE